jgi:hypothetical protein
MSHINRFILAVNGRVAELRARADEESEQGEIVEKVIIVAAVVAPATAPPAPIKALVDIKIGGIQL